MIRVDVPQQEIDEVISKLADMHAKIPYELRKAVNDAAKQTRNQIARKTKQRYASKKYNTNTIKSMMKIEKASISDLSATIKSRGALNEVKDFKVSNADPWARPRPKFISAKVLKNSSMTPLITGKIKAFAVQFRNGHVSVVTKVPNIRRNGNAKIRKIMSPAVPQMVKKIYEEENIDTEQILRESLDKTVAKLFAKK